MSATYSATATWEEGWWIVTVPSVDGVTQARRLGDVESMARELVAVTLDVPLDQVEIALAD